MSDPFDLLVNATGDLVPTVAIRKPKAADIADARLFAAIRACRGRNGVPRWATLWDVQAELGAYPAKVVLAKVRSAIRRGVIGGCGCGCRGDLELTCDGCSKLAGAPTLHKYIDGCNGPGVDYSEATP